MRNATASVVVDAPRDEVFAYLADIRNTPEWATEFIQEFQVIDDRRARAVTEVGEMVYNQQSYPETGVIDISVGPTQEALALFPARVVDLPGGQCAFLFTLFQSPNQTDEVFDAGFASLQRELENVKHHFETRAIQGEA